MSETGHALKVQGRRASIRRLFEARFNVFSDLKEGSSVAIDGHKGP